MKLLNALVLLGFLSFIPSGNASTNFFTSMVGKWSFHQRYLNQMRPGERWLMTHLEFYPNGRCVIRNQPNSTSCEWTQEATVAEFRVYSDGGQQIILWRGSLTDSNLFEGTGFQGDEAVARTFMIRDSKQPSADSPLDVRSIFGFWNLQYRKANANWTSNTLYASQYGKCTLDEPFESCTWTQNLKEVFITLKLGKNDSPLYFYISPLHTKSAFYGKIVDSFKNKKELGEFYLNSK